MRKVIGLEIDMDARDGLKLYRFHIEYEDGGTHGSCFCYESFEEAYFRAFDVLDKNIKGKKKSWLCKVFKHTWHTVKDYTIQNRQHRQQKCIYCDKERVIKKRI